MFVESWAEGVRKPDVRIFDIAFKRLRGFDESLMPNQVVFLDDIGVNCKAAQSVGWNAIRVEFGKEALALKSLNTLLGESML